MKKSNRFLAVDLAIESSANLEPLAAEFGERVCLNYCGPIPKSKGHFLALSTWPQYQEPDSAIQALCVLVETLSPAGKSLWDRARRKEFDVGYELERADTELHFALKPDTLARVASLGGSVGITCYRPTDEQRAARTKALAAARAKFRLS